MVSVAVFDREGGAIYEGARPSQGRASEACLAMLAESAIEPAEVSLWLADLGPGSFTGTRVGVVLAKTFAWTFDTRAGGLAAFDLIDPHAIVALPNRKNEWLIRIPGEPPKLAEAGSTEGVGYAPGLSEEHFPRAAAFSQWIGKIEPVPPELLVPGYVVPPSISIPKRAIP